MKRIELTPSEFTQMVKLGISNASKKRKVAIVQVTGAIKKELFENATDKIAAEFLLQDLEDDIEVPYQELNPDLPTCNLDGNNDYESNEEADFGELENEGFSVDKDFNPLPINFRKLQAFNSDFFDLAEVILFSHLIMLHSTVKRDKAAFYHSGTQFEKETFVKRTIQTRVLKRFENELHIINTFTNRKEIHCTKLFKINFKKIIDLLPKIFAQNVSLNEMENYFKSIAFAYKNNKQLEKYKKPSYKTSYRNKRRNYNLPKTSI